MPVLLGLLLVFGGQGLKNYLDITVENYVQYAYQVNVPSF